MTAPKPNGIRLAAADSRFHLTAEERASIRRGFDVDALERLSFLIPPVRPMVLESFQYPPPGQPADVVVKMGDPSLQPLLDEVWAPMWEQLPPSALEHEAKDFPGRELARQRRAARVERRPTQ